MFPSAFAQGTDTGTLAGTVQDSSGAVLPGVTVTVKRVATDTTRTVTTNDEGRYTIPVLPIGTYDVTFEIQGFQTVTATGVEVAATVTTPLDQALGVGGVGGEVTVRADVAPLISNESATTANSITARQLENSPLGTRSFTQLLQLDTGASADLSPVSVNSTGNVSPAINGTRTTSSSLLFNGIDATNITNEGSLSENISPAPETIQEVKVLTSLYDASVGRSGGGNIQLVTKSGSNNFNGSAYYYIQNERFNANDFFYNRDGIERQRARRNEGGFTIGGPVIKNKLLFFGGYQRTSSNTAYVPTAQSLVVLPEAFTLLPANAPRTEENILAAFRAFAPGNRFNNGEAAITPTTSAPIRVPDYIVRLFNLRNPETSGFFIPTARADAERLFEPNGIGRLRDRGRRNYPFTGNNPLIRQRNVVPARFNQDQFTTRLDYTVNAKNTLTGTFFFANFPAFDPFPESSLVSPTTLRKSDRNRTLSISDTHIFTDTIINEARFGYFYLDNSRRLDDQFLTEPYTNAAYGIINPATFFDDSDATRRLGNFAGTGNLDDFSFGAPNDIFNRRLQKTLTVADNVTVVRGSQTLRFGVEVKQQAFDTNLPEEQATQFERFESFGQLLGGLAPESDTQFGITDKQFRFSDVSVYATDDFKVTDSLTVNVGVRWDWFGLPTEKNGRISNFDFSRVTNPDDIRPGFILPSNTQMTGFRAIDESVAQIARVDNKHTLNGQDLNNFAPRVGFAFTPFKNGKTVVRGGYGVFFDRPSAAFINTVYSNYPFLREIETVIRFPFEGRLLNAFSQQNPNLPFANYLPFRVVYLEGGGNNPIGVFDSTPVTNLPSGEPSGEIDAITGRNVVGNRAETLEYRAVDRNLRTTYIQQWNFGVQQQFGNDWLIEARYIGTKGTKLLQAVGFNQPYDLNDPATPDYIFRRLNDAYERARQGQLARGIINLAPLRTGVSERERGRGIAYGNPNDALDRIQGNIVPGSVGQADASVPGAPFDFNISDTQASFSLIPLDARAPYLGFSNPEAIVLQSSGSSIYHSGQLVVGKRLSNNFQFNLSYTWSKAIDDGSVDPGSTASAGRPDVPNAGLVSQGDQRNLRANRAVADFDRPHRFSGNFIFEIPTFGSKSKLLTGFQLSGLAQVQSGTPFTIYSSDPEILEITDDTGLAAQYFGVIPGTRSNIGIGAEEISIGRATGGLFRIGFGRPSVRSLELLRQQGADRTRQYFNNRQDQNDPQTALLSPFGGFGNLGRNVLRGPSQKRFDLGLSKITRFSERAELELRWDIFNLFNFVNFANPNADLQDQSDFGQITRTVGGARTMQFGTKLRF